METKILLRLWKIYIRDTRNRRSSPWHWMIRQLDITCRVRANSRRCPQLARISVPWSATYVTNVRYSLGESRVRYVRGARSCIILYPRARARARYVIARAPRRSARMQHATTAMSSPRGAWRFSSRRRERLREETPPEYNRSDENILAASITLGCESSCLLEMSRTRGFGHSNFTRKSVYKNTVGTSSSRHPFFWIFDI